MSGSPRPVMCAVDGSGPSSDALAWAHAEACLRGVPLRLCAVAAPPPYGDGRLDPEAARDVLDEAMDQALLRRPAVPVTREVQNADHPPSALAALSASAQVLVVGRPRGGITARSLPMYVAEHAACPVVIGPATGWAGDGPVVVGVDETSRGRAALRFALGDAAVRRTPVVAVHAWSWPDGPSGLATGELADLDPARLAREAAALLERTVAAPAASHESVRVEARVVRGAAAHVLATVVPAAGLVVIGHRRRPALGRRVLGSVALEVIRRAPSPVALVRQQAVH